MTKFDRLRKRILLHTLLGELESERLLEAWRFHQNMLRNVQILVIDRHTCKVDIWAIAAIKMWKIVISEGHGHFQGTISTEININTSIAILNLTYRLAVLRNYEWRHILVLKAWVLSTISLNCFRGARELATNATNGSIPAVFDHLPVTFVAIRRNNHAAAATSNLIVWIT